MIYKFSNVSREVIHSDNISINKCTDIGIYYVLRHIFNLDYFNFVIVDLSLVSKNAKYLIDVEQIKCLGRVVEIGSSTIYIGFDSYVNDVFLIFFKVIILIFSHITKKNLFLINILFDLFLIIFFPLFLNFELMFFIFIIFISYKMNDYSSFKLVNLKLQKLLSFYFLLFNFLYIVFKITQVDYMIGYWLANYKYGFIKRGFAGNILLSISEFIPLFDLVSVINLFLIIVYAFLIYFVYEIFNSKEQSFISYFVFFSPAFVSFINFNDNVVGRPEILGALSFLYFYRNKENLNISKFLITVFLLSMSLFTHSINILVFPFITLILIQKNKLSLKLIIYLFVLTFIALLFIFMFLNDTNNQEISEKLCLDAQKLEIRQNICDGAIGWLGLSLEENSKMFYFWQDANQRFYTWYILLFSISLAPIIYSKWVNENFLIFAVTLFCLLPLLYLAYDWGRYFWLYIFIISILALSDSNNSSIRLKEFPIKQLILYSSIWFIPASRGLRIDNFYENIIYRTFIAIYLFTFIYLYKIDYEKKYE